jgi:hypothetical protein
MVILSRILIKKFRKTNIIFRIIENARNKEGKDFTSFEVFDL